MAFIVVSQCVRLIYYEKPKDLAVDILLSQPSQAKPRLGDTKLGEIK